MADVKMVVVDGIRYRPEAAPKQSKAKASPDEPEKKARGAQNKARTARNKEG